MRAAMHAMRVALVAVAFAALMLACVVLIVVGLSSCGNKSDANADAGYHVAAEYTTTAQETTNIKRCAAALTVLHAAADCTAIPNGGCTMTLSDLMRVQDAGADKQNYCPVPKPGEEGETP